MRERIERQIEVDNYRYYCIDTFKGLESFPICGCGYTEEEAIRDAEEQARRMFNYNVDDMQKSIDSGAIKAPDKDIADWINKG